VSDGRAIDKLIQAVELLAERTVSVIGTTDANYVLALCDSARRELEEP
jgi:hypothetical protein